MTWYRQRVERDLVRWQTVGWVNEAGAACRHQGSPRGTARFNTRRRFS